MTTNPNYYYAPSTIKNFLLTSTDSVVSNINCYTKNPVSDFTRIRKISANVLIKLAFEVMKELYHKRWNIEESFKTLKYAPSVLIH